MIVQLFLKQCANIGTTIFKWCVNIVQTMCKYCARIVETKSKQILRPFVPMLSCRLLNCFRSNWYKRFISVNYWNTHNTHPDFKNCWDWKKECQQVSSQKCSAWKEFRFKPLSFQFPQRDRDKCGGLGGELVLFQWSL